jgi:hypothetical protein
MRGVALAAIALSILLSLVGGASAFTLADWRYGDVLSPADARSLAMGGTGLAAEDGARGFGLNPALLGKTRGIEVAFTGLVISAEEARDMPVHDSFDGILVNNTYALNSSLYDRYIVGVAYRPSETLEWAPAIAVGYRPRLDMNYYYHVQYRDPDSQTEPNDKILYDYYAEGKGGVNAFTVALGQEVVPEVYVGLSVDFLRGDYDMSERWVYPPGSPSDDVSSRATYDNASGTQFTLGVLAESFHRVDVALVYRSAFELSIDDYSFRAAGSDIVETGSFTYRYPYAFAVGFEYHPRNELLTTVNVDIEYTRWSDFEDNLAGDPDLDDTIVYRVGVEHGYYDNTQARFGFVYEPSYTNNKTTRTGFCLGVGLNVLGARLDLGGQLGLRDYELGESRVRETTTLATATVVHRF